MVRLCGIYHPAISSLKPIAQYPYAKVIASNLSRSDFMDRFHKTLPVWVRAVLLVGLVCLVAGAGLVAYRYYQRPKTLTVAVGSFDGEARQAAQLVAGHLATTNSPIRLKIENAGNVLDAAKAFAEGKADLAVVRADVGDLSQARAVAVMAEGVVMIVAPPGSNITTIAKLRDHTVGVAGGEINRNVVEALKKEYDLAHANVTFKDIAPTDLRRAIQGKEVAAVIVVVPLTDKYLSLVKGLFHEGASSSPVLIPIDSAGAITDTKGPYESFDIPKGTLRGSPAVPGDDVTTLRVPYLLVANRHLDHELVAELTKRVMAARRDLASEQPLIAGIATPTLDADAYIAVHPGAAAFYNGTEQSFMDRWGNVIYLTPIVFGALASVFAAAWRFLGIRSRDAAQGTLEQLCALRERIRDLEDEAELRKIEDDIDVMLRAHLAKSNGDEESNAEALALIALAQRLDNLVHHRRVVLASVIASEAKQSSTK
jgi:TRAP-type uncharacterized transport system substrate-binding protein